MTRGFGSDSSDVLACRLSQAVNLLALHRMPRPSRRRGRCWPCTRRGWARLIPIAVVCKLNLATALRLREDYGNALAAAPVSRPRTGRRARRRSSVHAGREDGPARLSWRPGQPGPKLGRLTSRPPPSMTGSWGLSIPIPCAVELTCMLTRHERASKGRRRSVGDHREAAALLGPEHADIEYLARGRRLRVIDPQPF